MFAVSTAVFSEDAIIVMPDGKVGIGIEATSAELEVNGNGKFNGRVEDKSGVIMPVGTILPYAGAASSIPSGWLLCDGKAYTSTDDNNKYMDLFIILGSAWGNGSTGTESTNGDFNVPDLREQFMRGVDHGAGNDPDVLARTEAAAGGNQGDSVGSKQSSAMWGHKHHVQTENLNGFGSYAGFADVSPYGVVAPRCTPSEGTHINSVSCNLVATEAKSDSIHGIPALSSESRPGNSNVNFIIKY